MTKVFTRSALAAAIALAAACGGGSGGGYDAPASVSPTPTPQPPPASTAMVITITGENGSQSFSPNPAGAGGKLVVFRNADAIVHRVRLNDGTVDTGDIAPGATSREVLMPASGTNYHCSLHPSMIGAIGSEAGGGPPPCDGPYCDDDGDEY